MGKVDFDIMVVGGGLVGAATAVALAQQGHQVALVDRSAPDFSSVSASTYTWDSRIYAISPGNVQWLDSLGVWSKLNQARICPIEDMEVWGDANSQPLTFASYEANVTSLGYILESNQLQQALWSRMQDVGVHVKIHDDCNGLTIDAEKASLRFSDGTYISAKLVVAADGGNSWVRAQAGIASKLYTYPQMGVVANFEAELSHGQLARQWFHEDGVLAWLPLPGNRISMVWSTPGAHGLLELSPQALADKVAEAGGHTLGKMRTITNATAYPLVKQTAHRIVQARLVLVGDAAHRVHPLAGQGVNLGFRDVIALEKTLSHRNRYQEIGDLVLLRQYERARKTDMLALSAVTHGLQQLFDSKQPMLKKLRNLGLALTEHQPGLKRRLIKQAII
ncbi:MAG: UbiH/UbiF family hydroxylase [Candidatus Methylopumilus sp.]|jgi:ubiquinone biosynthesis UbiH/UbiF/VisC/COQ6 family hydroxylase